MVLDICLMADSLMHRFSADSSSSSSYAPARIYLAFVKFILYLSLLVPSFCLLPFFKIINVLNANALLSFPFICCNKCMLLYVGHISVFQHALFGDT